MPKVEVIDDETDQVLFIKELDSEEEVMEYEEIAGALGFRVHTMIGD